MFRFKLPTHFEDQNECYELFMKDLNDNNISIEDINNLPDFTNDNFASIIKIIDFWQLNDIDFEKFKDLVVFRIIFGEDKHLLPFISGSLLDFLAINNTCISNSCCSCTIHDIIGN